MTTEQKRNKIARRPGNPRSYPEQILGRFPAGTREQLRAVCDEDEDVADVIRAAIEREIRRRLR